MTQKTYLQYRIEEGIGELMLAGPRRYNILHQACLAEIEATIRLFNSHPEVTAIYITGSGDSFAVGANISEMVQFPPLQARAFAAYGQNVMSAVENSPKPVIAGLNGITMGGGVDLALACDIRLASDRLVLAHPGAKLGIITGWGGTQRLPRNIGAPRAREMLFSGHRYSGREALEMGLIQHLFADAEFASRAQQYLASIAEQPGEALNFAKKISNADSYGPAQSQQQMELGAFASLSASEYYRLQAQAFLRARN